MATAVAPLAEEPSTLVTNPPLPSTRAVWLAPLASAGLLYLSFFPVACGWLAWVALVPLLCLVRLPGRPRRRYLAAWLGGLAFYLPALQWARVADPRMYVTWVVLAVYCSLYLPVFVYLLRRLDRLPLTVTVPVVWVALEYVRWGWIGGFVALATGSYQHDYPGGFSWYFLGHTQHDFLPVIQVADLGGAYAVSFVVAAVNALAFEVLASRGVLGRYGKSALLLQGGLTGALLIGCLAYGHWRLGERTMTPGPRIALLQPSTDQRIRNTASDPDGEKRAEARRKVALDFRSLARAAVKQRPELLVTAETSFPGYWEELEHGRPAQRSRELAEQIGTDLRTPMLLGMNSAVGADDRTIKSHNSAILLDRDGSWLGRYDKIHRVPFGEYVPFKGLPFMRWLAPYDFDYEVSAGLRFTRFGLPVTERLYTFGVLICYEDTDPAMARPYAAAEPVDFLLNISNDGWFDGTSEHDQHLALCRFRAVETRRAIGRAVNMGVSAIIDSNGRVLAPRLPHATVTIPTEKENVTIPIWEVPEDAESLPVARWGEYKQVAGVLVGRIPIDTRSSVYARTGDWLAVACCGGVGLALVGSFRRRKEAVP